MRRVFWSRICRNLFFVCSIVMPAGAFADNAKLYDARVLSLFDKLTLSSDFGVAIEKRLLRWRQPLRIATLADSNRGHYEHIVGKIAEEFQSVTDHRLITKADKNVNVVFVFTNEIYSAAKTKYRNYFKKFVVNRENIDKYIDQNKKNKENWFIHSVFEPYAIRGGIVFISTRQSRSELQKSVIRALARTMGVMGVFRGKQDSLFYVRSEHEALTDLDRSLLKALYDKRLNNGMGRHEVLSILGGYQAFRLQKPIITAQIGKHAIHR